MAECNGTCWAMCGSNCSGQSGGGCIMCGGSIADSSCSCGHDCAGCGGTCTGGSKCSCGGNCSGGCGGSCSNTCQGECTADCGVGCFGEQATALFNILKAGLNKRILAADAENINTMIQDEAARRKKTTTSQTFSKQTRLDLTNIENLQKNLTELGQTTTITADSKTKASADIMQELIDKSIAAFEEVVSQK